jgi:hypothetical protein
MTSSEKSQEHKLKSDWTLYFHNPELNDWGNESYIKIYKFDTIEQFWALMNKIPQLHLSTGMYFLMRGDIKPVWEDELNKNGGCWSYKVSKKDASLAYKELLVATISENICPKEPQIINGASISPKKGFCIIKIWNNDNKKTSKGLLEKNIKYIDLEQTIYKSY